MTETETATETETGIIAITEAIVITKTIGIIEATARTKTTGIIRIIARIKAEKKAVTEEITGITGKKDIIKKTGKLKIIKPRMIMQKPAA